MADQNDNHKQVDNLFIKKFWVNGIYNYLCTLLKISQLT